MMGLSRFFKKTNKLSLKISWLSLEYFSHLLKGW